MNKCFFSGRIGNEPEFKEFGDTKVLSFRFAVPAGYKKDDEEPEPYWITVKLFGNRAVALADILTKGMPLTLECRMHVNKWETDEGDPRSRVEFVVQDVVLPPKQNGGGDKKQKEKKPASKKTYAF